MEEWFNEKLNNNSTPKETSSTLANNTYIGTYKKYLLKCQIFNYYPWKWEDRELYFDTEEEMISFIKNGTEYIQPKDIRVEAAFILNKIDIKL